MYDDDDVFGLFVSGQQECYAILFLTVRLLANCSTNFRACRFKTLDKLKSVKHKHAVDQSSQKHLKLPSHYHHSLLSQFFVTVV